MEACANYQPKAGRQISLRHKKLPERTLGKIGFGYHETQQSKLDSIRFGKILYRLVCWVKLDMLLRLLIVFKIKFSSDAFLTC